MKATGQVVGFTLFWLGYVYCFVMLWVNVIQWWGWSAIWAFILSPILALAIPIISWIVEGAFPVLLLAGWGGMILGGILAKVCSKE